MAAWTEWFSEDNDRVKDGAIKHLFQMAHNFPHFLCAHGWDSLVVLLYSPNIPFL